MTGNPHPFFEKKLPISMLDPVFGLRSQNFLWSKAHSYRLFQADIFLNVITAPKILGFGFRGFPGCITGWLGFGLIDAFS